MKERVLAVLQGVNQNIVDGVDLIAGGIIDSFEVVNIVVELETEFDIEIDPEDVVAENFSTVDAIVKLVEKGME